MVVEGHGQMVSNQILSRDSEVQWVPVLEFSSDDSELVFRDGALLVGSIQEDVVPSFTSKFFVLNAESSSNSTFQIA